MLRGLMLDVLDSCDNLLHCYGKYIRVKSMLGERYLGHICSLINSLPFVVCGQLHALAQTVLFVAEVDRPRPLEAYINAVHQGNYWLLFSLGRGTSWGSGWLSTEGTASASVLFSPALSAALSSGGSRMVVSSMSVASSSDSSSASSSSACAAVPDVESSSAARRSLSRRVSRPRL
jgi:hypothetical protein